MLLPLVLALGSRATGPDHSVRFLRIGDSYLVYAAPSILKGVGQSDQVPVIPFAHAIGATATTSEHHTVSISAREASVQFIAGRGGASYRGGQLVAPLGSIINALKLASHPDTQGNLVVTPPASSNEPTETIQENSKWLKNAVPSSSLVIQDVRLTRGTPDGRKLPGIEVIVRNSGREPIAAGRAIVGLVGSYLGGQVASSGLQVPSPDVHSRPVAAWKPNSSRVFHLSFDEAGKRPEFVLVNLLQRHDQRPAKAAPRR